jgi:hypothetical protein
MLIGDAMSIPTRSCSRCGKDFKLRPDKPGYANLCPECSLPQEALERKAKEDAKLHSAKAAASRKSSRKLELKDTKPRLKLRRLLQRANIEPQKVDEIVDSIKKKPQ